MLLDFDEHRLHRRALSVAFKSGPMKSYLAELDTGIAARVAQWKAQPGEMLFYPAMKQLTLDLAATSFLGAEIGPGGRRDHARLCRHGGGVGRRDPQAAAGHADGARRQRAQAHRRLFLRADSDPPRQRGGDDLFSQLCHATHEDGALLSTQDIVDHMSFLMMAAHDTLTSSLTSFVGELAAHPEWQHRLRDEVNGLGIAADAPTSFDNLEAMPLSEMAFKEALRLKPPVPSMPRRAVRDFTFKGYAIPAGTMVGINPLFTHHMPEIWPDPETFDPMRFTDEAQRNRHRFAWVPFGGGAHMCLGLHFAYMQAKSFARHFLQNLEVSLAARLQAGLADVADPEAARRAGWDEAGVTWLAPSPEGGWGEGLSQDGDSLWLRMASATSDGHPRKRGRGDDLHCSSNVVSCAPSSATNTAINSAGSVLLALAETRCVEPGGSKNDCPTLKVSTGPPPSCERISPLVT